MKQESTAVHSDKLPPGLATERLLAFISEHPNLVVLTGAGISAASGIPTYRDHAGTWTRNTPIQHRDFLQHEATRRRYWTRSFSGWPAVHNAKPNTAHLALAQGEANGRISMLVTQNIDRLHQRAGHQHVIDLHGRLDEVICLNCLAKSSRALMQERLAELNPHLQHAAQLLPDGDADVEDACVNRVVIPECLQCGGVLKPDVVFFGDSVDREKVAQVNAAIDAADALLVIGSSLMVFSGYRFCRYAAENSIPLACINAGVTRADHLFQVKINADCSSVLQQVFAV